MSLQKTLKDKVIIKSVGQHSGNDVEITINPAPINTGIVFKRTDIDAPELKMNFENIFGSMGCTCVGDENGINVKTIEHLVSAIAGLQIDNALIEVNGNEIPITDGSSIPPLEAMEKVGVVEENANKKYIKILKEVVYEDDNGKVSLSPNSDFDGLTLDVKIDYSDTPAIGIEEYKLNLTPQSYKKEIAPARTFARMSDVEYLHSKGLCLGATLNSGVAVEGDKVLNPEGLRFKDEFVRHKILDAVGDLYSLGYQVKGYYKSFKGGHVHNNALCRKLWEDKSSFEIIE